MTMPGTAELARLRHPVRRLIGVGVCLGGLGALGTLVPFIGLAELGRILLAGGPVDSLGIVAVVAAVILGLILSWVLTGAALWVTHIADHRLQATLRRALVRKLGRVPLGWYSDKTSGLIRKAVQGDLKDLHHLVAHHDVDLAAAIVLPIGGLAYVIWLDWRLGLLAVATLPVYLIAYAWMMRGFADKMTELDTTFARVNAAIVEFVQGIAVVKAFGRVGKAHEGYRQAVTAFSDRYTAWVRPLLRLEALTSMAVSAPVILLVSLSGGAWFISRGWVAPIDVLAEALVAVVLPQTLLTLTQGLTAHRKAVAAAGRILDLLDAQDLPVADRPRRPEGGTVSFDHVSFGYAADRPVLRDVTLTCRPGTVTALVGPSGAGKSTLAKLVPRFHDVTAGSLRVGGVDVREIAPDVLYRHVGFVLQDVQLLHGTVADNIRLGRPDASFDAVVAAARAARIHDRVMALPRQYDSVLDEDAVFSGGEAQRISIARALLADTPVLILDEATAHADPDSEARVQEALSTVARGRTVLVIAHRLATITAVDQIVVVDDGRVSEVGTHDHLVRAGGLYARLWKEATGEAEPWGREPPAGSARRAAAGFQGAAEVMR
ncbi:ABC transporter transmembrane region [Rhodospirillum rubrum F11]|uniref:ABC transporter, transmembrane region n=2 Tax=Rhodospirillum rubrum TaxID=1085 RepID=Q2RRV5_RHORT|nr:ABC transporter ATP-binding protein [Rhodospirillum rubrum]ABC23140.1 ABC transporter, transmembrane region [Rhodospirillum rubrum ATCC 11170]AEO48871.1 ABC transporter transmembrane region [Rhodospirillum rubrum F11]MBK5954754.1 ABC transporter ATP-binding protein [Rhodospirillum rubrum]QXG79123.1 ABC transporter ATP-binding protein/permease [Rhodospirillum rubrum]HCF16810.1 ABC transporter ATP-binding protein [Rhodospirillum rubrum]